MQFVLIIQIPFFIYIDIIAWGIVGETFVSNVESRISADYQKMVIRFPSALIDSKIHNKNVTMIDFLKLNGYHACYSCILFLSG